MEKAVEFFLNPTIINNDGKLEIASKIREHFRSLKESGFHEHVGTGAFRLEKAGCPLARRIRPPKGMDVPDSGVDISARLFSQAVSSKRS